jgi:hypothetical protein
MMRIVGSLSLTLAALAVAAAAASAEAGTITGKKGSVRINGTDVALEAGKPIATKAGDKIQTSKDAVVWRSDTGDDITIDADSFASEQPTDGSGAALLLSKGSISGILSEKTQIGVAVGWISAPKGEKSRVIVEATPGREAAESTFISVDGNAWIRYREYKVLLRPSHSVTLDIDAALPGTLCFRTGQQNPGDVDIHRSVPGGDILAAVPKATLGCFTDEKDNKTKICNDVNSLKSGKIKITTRFTGKNDNTASIGPATCALIDNTTGQIEVLFTAVNFEILVRAINLTTEFTTLAQSNFSDVSQSEGPQHHQGGGGNGEGEGQTGGNEKK